MEQLQIAFSQFYDVIRDNANSFEKLLIYINRFKKKTHGHFQRKKDNNALILDFFIN